MPIDADLKSAGEDWPEDFVKYWDSQDNKHFPFVKTGEVQLPPLVAVMITPNSRFEDETSVEIECRAFYEGLYSLHED